MTDCVADGVLGKFARQVASAVQNIIDRGHPFKYDKRKDGWELVEDVEVVGKISIANLELVPFIDKGKNLISGEEMRKMAKELDANLGQRHAEFLLKHQAKIPEEFRKYYIVFTGTIWRSQDGRLMMAYLHWDSKQWVLHFTWLEYAWRSFVRLGRPRK